MRDKCCYPAKTAQCVPTLPLVSHRRIVTCRGPLVFRGGSSLLTYNIFSKHRQRQYFAYRSEGRQSAHQFGVGKVCPNGFSSANRSNPTRHCNHRSGPAEHHALAMVNTLRRVTPHGSDRGQHSQQDAFSTHSGRVALCARSSGISIGRAGDAQRFSALQPLLHVLIA
jgi:hypothetical protein